MSQKRIKLHSSQIRLKMFAADVCVRVCVYVVFIFSQYPSHFHYYSGFFREIPHILLLLLYVITPHIGRRKGPSATSDNNKRAEQFDD